jgi:Rrf2 family transcriptional regulator, cysteine metabolism repressor
MHFSVKGEYALKAIFDLSSQNSKEPVKIADIARRQDIPQKFLELILASLKQGGFVASRRGAEGGYMLAKPAESTTMGAVLRYVDGARDKVRSDEHVDSPFGEVWERVEKAISAELDNTNFAGLCREWSEKQNQFVPNWEI